MRNSNVGSGRGDMMGARTITVIRLNENRARVSILSTRHTTALLHVE